MGFIFKCVIILLVFSFIVYVMKAITRLSAHLRTTVKDMKTLRDQVGGQTPPSAEMVRCSACGAFVAARDAVTVSGRGRAQTYCSNDCLLAHAKRA